MKGVRRARAANAQRSKAPPTSLVLLSRSCRIRHCPCARQRNVTVAGCSGSRGRRGRCRSSGWLKTCSRIPRQCSFCARLISARYLSVLLSVDGSARDTVLSSSRGSPPISPTRSERNARSIASSLSSSAGGGNSVLALKLRCAVRAPGGGSGGSGRGGEPERSLLPAPAA